MAENSAIAWTKHSFAPWHGCTKVGPGCDGCYAENLMANRFKRVVWGPHGKRERASQSTWDEVRAWNRKAAAAGEQATVFVSHLSDVFDKAADPTWRADLFLQMHETPHLLYLILTKRMPNVLKMAPGLWPKNAALGCTVVNQAEADRDVPQLLAAKRALRPAFAFVSVEPMLGLVDLTRLNRPRHWRLDEHADALRGWRATSGGQVVKVPGLDWVICGGETDQGKHRARDMDEAWAGALLEQCADAGVPFFMKQMTRLAPIPAHLQVQQWPAVAMRRAA